MVNSETRPGQGREPQLSAMDRLLLYVGAGKYLRGLHTYLLEHLDQIKEGDKNSTIMLIRTYNDTEGKANYLTKGFPMAVDERQTLKLPPEKAVEFLPSLIKESIDAYQGRLDLGEEKERYKKAIEANRILLQLLRKHLQE